MRASRAWPRKPPWLLVAILLPAIDAAFARPANRTAASAHVPQRSSLHGSSHGVAMESTPRDWAQSAASNSTWNARRGLLQGRPAPNATLPNLFQLPVCSIHGSHPTTMLRTLPRVHAGVFTFGAQNLEEDEFSPTSSMYMEPVLILAVPGATLFLFFLLSCCCFCYRRYRLGLCGEPIPTVTAYTPKEVCLSRTVALLSFAALLAAAFAAIVVSNASYSAGFQDIVASGYQTERIVNDSFKVGEELLQDSLAVSVELDDFNVHVAAQVDVQLLQLNLVCSRTLLSELPNGEIMRQGTADLGIAANAVPDASLTEGLFTALRRPQQQYPLLVPPLTTGLTSLQARVAALPDQALPRRV